MVPAAADLLRARGIQVTAQRLAVFQTVAGRQHITADVVAEVYASDNARETFVHDFVTARDEVMQLDRFDRV